MPREKRPAAGWRVCVAGATLLVSLIGLSSPLLAEPAHPPVADEVLGHVRFLASDELAGRATGTPGCEAAGDYIAKLFQDYGIKPLAGLNGYFQDFTATIATTLGPGNELTVSDPEGKTRAFTLNADYVPFGFSASAECNAPLLFAGYGITAPEYKYDDYNGVEARGKVVLVLRHEPQDNDSTSVFEGRRPTHYSEFRYKVRNAELHGAAGILVVNDPLSNDDDLIKFGRGGGASAAVSIPAAQIRLAAAETFLGGAELPGGRKSLRAVQEEIDRALAPASFDLAGDSVRLKTDLPQTTRPTANVVGYLPPTTPRSTATSRPAAGANAPADSSGGPTADEYVVVGAHYDHLGMGGEYSLVPDTVAVHNGADDNASGTAAMLGVARAIASDPAPRERGVLFVAFTGEEMGLLGSGWFVNHPPLPIGGVVAMINMDMVGRMRNDRLLIGGVGTSPRFKPLLEPRLNALGIKADYSEGGVGPSDHTSFYSKDRPVLFFFTGVHEDYHKPSDDWQKINADGLERVTTLALEVTEDLTRSSEPVAFVRTAADTARGSRDGGGGYGAYLGTIPDFGGPEGEGVKISGVRSASPAEKAGLKGSDIITGFGGHPIRNLYDLTDELRAHRTGDVVQIVVRRGEETLTLTATLGKR